MDLKSFFNSEINVLYLLCFLVFLAVAFLIYISLRVSKNRKLEKEIREFREEYPEKLNDTKAEILDHVGFLLKTEKEVSREAMDNIRKSISDTNVSIDNRISLFSRQTSDDLDKIRQSVRKSVQDMQLSNEKKLDEMRRTVDEKLEKSLNETLSRSFIAVNEHLDRMYQSLGEIQKVGRDVDNLNRVLTNVKTRGTLGEVSLSAILREILAPEQFEEQLNINPDNSERVDFAVKLPGSEYGTVFLPVDSKFPIEPYQTLLNAYDEADRNKIQEAEKELVTRLKGFAKSIHDKYIFVPKTTDFAIMYLPVEGLYAEAVRLGLVETLQNRYKVNIAGPTTMAALLNSLQMGFRTLAIQKRSGEVWKTLNEVKTEFAKFGEGLAKAQDRVRQASEELDRLSTTRTNAIERKLRGITDDNAPEEIS